MRGTTRVRPRENGAGWLTCGVSLMLTVRLPCATATVETRTSRPITMMPERSSITILAGRSGSICKLLDLGQQRDHLAVELLRDGELHGRGIERLGGRRADDSR